MSCASLAVMNSMAQVDTVSVRVAWRALAICAVVFGTSAGCPSGGSSTTDRDGGLAGLHLSKELSDSDHDSSATVSVGDVVRLRLHSVGAGYDELPTLSSESVKFDGIDYPHIQNPGGPTQDFYFEAVSSGSTVVTVSHGDASVSFVVKILVR